MLPHVRSALLALFAFILAGCTTAQPPAAPIDYSQQLPSGTLALRKLSPGEYPDFSAAILSDNVPNVTLAINRSLQYLATPSSQNYFPYADISHDRAVASLQLLKQIIDTQSMTPALDGGRQFNSLIRSTFDVYQSIGAPDPNGRGYTSQVLFTGYFTPTYNASLTRVGPYQWPLYKRPADLVTDSTGEHAYRRQSDGTLVPYYTRAQIEQNHLLDGQELVWLTDRFEAYIITVQGSARLRLPDGRIYEVGYNGNNGYDYVSPINQMVSDGLITKQQRNLRDLRTYFAAHPQAMDKYLPMNPRYIFFTERPGGPFGSLNVPVTPYATIATDKSIYPRAMPAFVVASLPGETGEQSLQALMLDQDTGGGIRASGRCDIYMGVGDAAEKVAGRELSTGQLYYLAIKTELMNHSAQP